MRRRVSRGRAAALAASALLLLAAGDPSKPGAYCPLPKAGEVPACLAGAQETYQGFFLGVEEGKLDEAEAERVEAAVRGGEVEALSSLSYGYFVLANALSREEAPNPALRARLERWNALLSETWAESEEDPRYRAAVREAAEDIGRNVPALGLRCTDAEGRVTECASTEAVIRAMDARRQETGLRGALARLLTTLFGEPEAP